VTVSVEFIGVRLDVSCNLSAQRRRQHLADTVTHDLVQQR
jgi:hypothetical protein